jgi:hypothetical protein
VKILEYTEFCPPRNKAQYDKVRQAIERDHFRSVYALMLEVIER